MLASILIRRPAIHGGAGLRLRHLPHRLRGDLGLQLRDRLGQRHRPQVARRSGRAPPPSPRPRPSRRRPACTGSAPAAPRGSSPPSSARGNRRSTRKPASRSCRSTSRPYASDFSLTVSTRACSGASHSGNAPAKCSIRTPHEPLHRPERRPVDHHRPVRRGCPPRCTPARTARSAGCSRAARCRAATRGRCSRVTTKSIFGP